MFRLLFILAPIFLVLFSCQKEDQPDAPGNRLKMISTKDGDSISWRSFQYDDQNRLIAIHDSNNNGYQWRRVISYDWRGKLETVTEEGTIYTFDFDDQGRIIRKWGTYSGQQSAIVRHTYAYDIDGRVISDSSYSYFTPTVSSIVSYVYDQNNNVIESKAVETSVGVILTDLQFVYDSHPNPLSSQSVITYLLSSGYEIPEGKNNLLKIKNRYGDEVGFNYEYYSNGLPKSCFLLDNTDPQISYTEYY